MQLTGGHLKNICDDLDLDVMDITAARTGRPIASSTPSKILERRMALTLIASTGRVARRELVVDDDPDDSTLGIRWPLGCGDGTSSVGETGSRAFKEALSVAASGDGSSPGVGTP